MTAKTFRTRPTGAKRTIDGVVFLSWHIGILRYEWRSEDDRIHVWDNGHHRSTYSASVDGEKLKPRFQSDRNAARAAVKAMQRKDRERAATDKRACVAFATGRTTR